MKIAIYGGSFNPIHRGHIEFANLISNYCDEVWLMPCKNHAFNKELESATHRSSMALAAVKNNKNQKIKVSFYEIFSDSNGSSYETLKKLAALHLQQEFYFAIGADCAEQIGKWKNSDLLMKEFPFIVVDREGYETTQDWFAKPPHCHVAEKIHNVSSTDIRNSLKSTPEAAADRLDGAVYKYILANDLYGVKK